MSELKACGDAMYQYLELCSKKSCAKLLENVINKYKKVDVLVNAAGVRGKADPPFETDYEDLERTMQINFTGTIRMATMTAEYMKRQGEGTIINISSISGSMVTAPDYGYHCSKCALDMATKILAKEVSPYGVRCLTVAPGGVKAGMNSSEWERTGKKLHIRNRLLTAGEVAGAVYLLSTKEASAVNGTVLMLDDGYTAYKGIY